MRNIVLKTMFEKDICRIVQGETVLLRRFQIAKLYNCWEPLLMMGAIAPLFL